MRGIRSLAWLRGTAGPDDAIRERAVAAIEMLDAAPISNNPLLLLRSPAALRRRADLPPNSAWTRG